MFPQDGNGGIWLADIEVAANAKPLRRLAKFHGDIITSLQSSPVGYFIATTSLDGWLHIHDVLRKQLIFMHNFNVPITSSIWLPLKVHVDYIDNMTNLIHKQINHVCRWLVLEIFLQLDLKLEF